VPLIPLALPLSSDTATHPQVGAARLINGFARPTGERSKTGWVIDGVSGLSLFSTLSHDEGIRAVLPLSEANGLAMAGRQLFRFDLTGTAENVGGVPTTGPVSMAVNGVGEVAIVSDGLYYSYIDGELTRLADPDLAPPIMVCSIGGYFVFMIEDGRIFASELNDFAVDGLSYATAEASPDKGRAVWVRGDDVFVGGTRSIEVWTVEGTVPFPLRKVTTVIDPATQQTVGVIARGAAMDGVFAASDKTIKLLDGYRAVTISPPAVNEAIAAEESPQDITVTRWSDRGHTHYAFSGTDWTWVYDATTKLWHERRSGTGRWIVSHTMEFGGKVIAGDRLNGKLYELSPDVFAENSVELVTTIQSAPVSDFPHRLQHRALHLDMAVGVGTSSQTNPQVMIDWSDDGVHYSTQLMRSLGAEAQTNGQIRVNNLGSAFQRTYRMQVSSAVRRLTIGGKIEASRMGRV